MPTFTLRYNATIKEWQIVDRFGDYWGCGKDNEKFTEALAGMLRIEARRLNEMAEELLQSHAGGWS